MPDEKEAMLIRASNEWFPEVTHSANPTVDGFSTEIYRCLQLSAKAQTVDHVREFIRIRGPRVLTWSAEDRASRQNHYEAGLAPQNLSPSMDRLARFLVAMIGALFILVPVYIMSLNQNQTRNLVTTTVAMVFFTMICSVMLRTTVEQTLGFTAAYAAVLVVFVGLNFSDTSSAVTCPSL